MYNMEKINRTILADISEGERYWVEKGEEQESKGAREREGESSRKRNGELGEGGREGGRELINIHTWPAKPSTLPRTCR